MDLHFGAWRTLLSYDPEVLRAPSTSTSTPVVSSRHSGLGATGSTRSRSSVGLMEYLFYSHLVLTLIFQQRRTRMTTPNNVIVMALRHLKPVRSLPEMVILIAEATSDSATRDNFRQVSNSRPTHHTFHDHASHSIAPLNELILSSASTPLNLLQSL